MGAAFTNEFDRDLGHNQSIDFGKEEGYGKSRDSHAFASIRTSEPDDVCHKASAEAALTRAAAKMPNNVRARIGYAERSGNLVIRNMSGMSGASDIRVIAAA